MAKVSRFRKGQSTFKCRGCGKQTRDVDGGNGGVELCELCYVKAGLENQLNDNGFAGDAWAVFDDCKTVDEVDAVFQREWEKLHAPKAEPAATVPANERCSEPGYARRALAHLREVERKTDWAMSIELDVLGGFIDAAEKQTTEQLAACEGAVELIEAWRNGIIKRAGITWQTLDDAPPALKALYDVIAKAKGVAL